ncbi:TPA: hypothetical protein RSW70_003526 [Vibrio cholerae]|nr:hypothetical protein [Vibrio cholerae]HDZ3708195.1 hypothetical protein [Vibrio cholerae]HDZ3753258.1 hypothetical protein [Vibrio cholerae]HDZ3767701.1 hypothetical protein [Vibrio cholerae]
MHENDPIIKQLVENGTISFSASHAKLATKDSLYVWKSLSNIRFKGLEKYKDYLNPSYIDECHKLYGNCDGIPTLDYLNNYFSHTGWEFVWTNKIKEEEFFYLCSKKVFPITTYSRSRHELDRSVYPDFVHDLWGHVPMLNYKNLFEFLYRVSTCFISYKYSDNDERINLVISEIARTYKNTGINRVNKDIIRNMSQQGVSIKKKLSRLILFSFEFGVIEGNTKDDKFEVYGGGILSSDRELDNLVKHKNFIRLYMKSLVDDEYNLHDKQSLYHSISEFDELFKLMESVVSDKELELSC